MNRLEAKALNLLRDQPLRRELVSSALVYLAAIVLPRVNGIAANVSFWDDGIEPIEKIWQQYRFLAAAQIQLGEWLLGIEFMLGPGPKLLAIASVLVAATCLERYFLSLGVARRFALPTIALGICHPVFNDAFLWNTGAVILGLPLLALTAGLLVAANSTGWIDAWAAAALIAVAISGYQLHAGTAFSLAAFAWLVDRHNRKGERVFIVMILAGVLYGASVAVSRFVLDWSPARVGRTVSVTAEVLLTSEFLRGKLKGLSNILAVEWQPVLSSIFGRDPSFRLWYIVWMTMWLLGIIGFLRVPSRRSRYFAIAVPMLSVAPLAPLLLSPFNSIGFRTAAVVHVATSPVVLLALMGTSGRRGAETASSRRLLAFRALGALIGLAIVRTTAQDAAFRVEANRQDRQFLIELAGATNEETGGANRRTVVLCERGGDVFRPSQVSLVSGFQPLGAHSYSNLNLAPAWVAQARREGMDAEEPSTGECAAVFNGGWTAGQRRGGWAWPHVDVVVDGPGGATLVMPRPVSW